jgi:hypothetical protein
MTEVKATTSPPRTGISQPMGFSFGFILSKTLLYYKFYIKCKPVRHRGDSK